MLYNDFLGNQVSRLGFGAMRLPEREDKSLDQAQVQEMVDYAMANGVNYFDTALVYGMGTSEEALKQALAGYPRESYYMADKFPGHMLYDSFDPAATFQRELDLCGVEYFDYYLLHNVYEKSIQTYMDSRWNILPYLIKERDAGRIRHLGFSTHGRMEIMEQWLDFCDSIEPGCMEFCQIQCNYLDWKIQDAEGKYRMLTDRGIQIVVMEPLRGGKFAHMDEATEQAMKALRPADSIASWSFRWLQDLPDLKVILSGMSNMDQVIDNVHSFAEEKPLNAEEKELIDRFTEAMRDDVPCTGCRYCANVCPMELDIPRFLRTYGEIKVAPSFTTGMQIEFMDEDKKPSACLDCGQCMQVCPQNIEIPVLLKDLADRLEKVPKWGDISRSRIAEEMKRKDQN